MGVFIVNYILYWCYKQESNLQLSPCKRDTRPLSYCSNLKWRGDQDLNLNLRFWKPLAYLQLSPRLLFYLNWMRKQESNLPNQAYETCQCPALFSALVLFYFTLIFWQNSLGFEPKSTILETVCLPISYSHVVLFGGICRIPTNNLSLILPLS